MHMSTERTSPLWRILLVYVYILIFIACVGIVHAAQEEDVFLNPSHKDKRQELMRLRAEGAAHFENGIAQKKALASFEKALKVNPRSAVEHFNLGAIYKKLSMIEESKKHLRKSIELEKTFPHPYYTLGLIHLGEGDSEAALAYFRDAARLMPNEPSAQYQLSRIYREANKSDLALQAIVETLRLDPYHTGALYQLYLYHQQSDDKEKAEQVFAEFSRIKRAVGRTRKEVNPDESVLALPVIDEVDFATSGPKPRAELPDFSVLPVAGVGHLAGYVLADVNNDGEHDLVAVEARGAAELWIGAGGQFSLLEKGPKFSELSGVQLAKLERSAPYSLLASTEKGLVILPLINKLEMERSKKSSHGSSGKPDPIRVAFGTLKMVTKDGGHSFHIADVDHDGDSDLVIGDFKQFYVNRGDAQFDLHSGSEKSIPGLVKGLGLPLVGSDLRNGVGIDFVAVDSNGERSILRDEMGGVYSKHNASLGDLGSILWHDIADINNDGWTDIVSLTPTGLVVDYNRGDLTFIQKAYKAPAQEVSGAVILDFNNDGFKDIAYSPKKGGIYIWRNSGNQEFVNSGQLTTGGPLKQLQAADLDGDGLQDITALDAKGALVLLKNKTKVEASNWFSVKLDGVRSSPDGRYTQLEVRYGSYYAKYESSGGIMHIPLGAAPHAEVLRITWPSGFVENKFNVQSGENWYFEESERISGSCPSVYAWNGQRYTYITDAFISGPMGVPIAPGSYFPVGDDEYLKIPGEHLRAGSDGALRVSIVEELREVTYLDQVRLVAVDYPDDLKMFPNEHLLPPDFPDFKLHLTRHGAPPTQAFDHNGNEVTELVRDADYQYPHDFSRLNYTGFVDQNAIELGLSRNQLHGENLRLFLTGWFYYFDSTSLMAMAQQPNLEFIWPQVQVMRDGEWQFLKRIGIPSGKEKTVVVELGGEVPEDAEAIRLYTNIELYWDRVLVDTTSSPASTSAVLNDVSLVSGRLRLHGFSKLLRPESDFPLPDRFDYHDTSYRSLWNPLRGKYTRYGGVKELIDQVDSKLAVLGSGDEISLVFDGSMLPPLQKGYKRDYLLYLNGFVKDGDKYTAHPGTVDPMPYGGMNSYPFTERQWREARLDRADYRQYIQDYQKRSPLQFTGPDIH